MRFNRPLILASKSPRRAQLLYEAGFEFDVVGLDVSEDFPADMPAEEVAGYLACRKALGGSHLVKDREVLIAADSTVVLDGVIYNKPEDYADARRMLRALSGRRHRVVTGVCIYAAEQQTSFSGKSDVWFDEITDAEIEYYIEACQPYDKAGAYGVQEWIGLCKITRIEGTYANVMGLPVDMVYAALKKFSPT
ncbi:MAG: Maf family protein [Saprospiraceae bacterium]